MPDTRPRRLDGSFAGVLQLSKAQLLRPTGTAVAVAQQGAAFIECLDRPRWPKLPSILDGGAPVIETFVCGVEGVEPTSVNEPYVSAWLPLATWMNTTVRSALAEFDVDLIGNTYLTASLTPRPMHEGTPHLDDDLFEPDENVGVVAIIGEHVGPSIAIGHIEHGVPAPSTQLRFADAELSHLALGSAPSCRCGADELVVFPQFGQLHAGPTADELPAAAPSRQLLVLRARASTITRGP